MEAKKIYYKGKLLYNANKPVRVYKNGEILYDLKTGVNKLVTVMQNNEEINN